MKKILSLVVLSLSIISICSCADDIVFKGNQTTATPPGTPSQIGITSITSSSFEVYWSKPLFLGTLPGGGEASVSYYEVSYSRSSDFTPEQIFKTNPPVNSGDRVVYPVTGLDANTKYYVRVRVFNNNSDSQKNASDYTAYNNGGAMPTASAETPPSSPTGIRFSNYGKKSFDVTWNAPTDPGKKPNGALAKITGYKVEWDVVEDFSSANIFTVITTRLSHPIRNLRPNTDYYVRVYSINDNGGDNTSKKPLKNEGNPAKTLSLETKPDSPSNIRLVDVDKTKITVSFDGVPPFGYGLFPDGTSAQLSRYEILISESNLFTNAIPNPTTINAGVPLPSLTPGTNYYLKVRAVNNNLGPLGSDQNNSFRFSDWENYSGVIQTLSDSSRPDPVRSISASGIQSDRLTVSWTPPNNFGKRSKGDVAQLINYRVRWSTSNNFTGIVSSGFTTGTSYDVKSLVPNESYYIEVVTISDSDDDTKNISIPAYLNGSISSSIKTSSAESAPNSPRDVQTVSVRETEVELRWQASSNKGKTIGGEVSVFRGYKVYYSDSDRTLSITNTGTSRTIIFPTGVGGNDFIKQTTITVSGLTPNKKYYMAVVAVNNNGSINTSNKSYLTSNLNGSITTRSAITSPKKLIKQSLDNLEKTSVSLSWQVDLSATNYGGLQPDGTASTITGYEVQYSTGSTFSTGLTREKLFNATSNPVGRGTISPLTPNTLYYWRVRAISTNETPYEKSSWSERKEFKTKPDFRTPSAPLSFGPGALQNTKNKIYVSWRRPLDYGANADGLTTTISAYRVYYSKALPIDKTTAPYANFASDVTTGIIDGVGSNKQGATPTPGQRYYMTIVAINAEALESPSRSYADASGTNYASTASAEEIPGIVRNLTISPGTNEVSFNFLAPDTSNFGKNPQGNSESLSRFEIYVDLLEATVKSASSSAISLGSVPYVVGTGSYSSKLTGLAPDTPYFIAIFTVNKNINTAKNISNPPIVSKFKTTKAFRPPSPPISLIVNGAPAARGATLQLRADPTLSGKGADGSTRAKYEKFIVDICREDVNNNQNFCGMNDTDLENPNLNYNINREQKQRVVSSYSGTNTVIFNHNVPVTGLRPGSTYFARVFAVNVNVNSASKYSGATLLSGSTFKTISSETKPTFLPNSNIVIRNITTTSFIVDFQAFNPGENAYGRSYSQVSKYIITTSEVSDFNSANSSTKSVSYTTNIVASGLNSFLSPNLLGNTNYYVKVEAENTNINQKKSLPLVYKNLGSSIATVTTKSNYQRPAAPSTFTLAGNPTATPLGFLDFNIDTNSPNATPGRNSKGVIQTISRYEVVRTPTPNVRDANALTYTVDKAAANSGFVRLGNSPGRSNAMVPGKSYYFYVRAINSDTTTPSNTSASSDVVINNSYNSAQTSIVIIPTATTAPNPPSNLSITNIGDGSSSASPLITLTWGKSTQDSGGGYGLKEDATKASLKNYLIKFYTAPLATNPNQNATATISVSADATTSPTQSENILSATPGAQALSVGIQYYISVMAVNDANDISDKKESIKSNEIKALLGVTRPTGLVDAPTLKYVGYDRIILQPREVTPKNAGREIQGGNKSVPATSRYTFLISSTRNFQTIINQVTVLRTEEATLDNLSPSNTYFVKCILSNNTDATKTSDEIIGAGARTNTYITNRSPTLGVIVYELTTFKLFNSLRYRASRNSVATQVTNRRARGTHITRKTAGVILSNASDIEKSAVNIVTEDIPYSQAIVSVVSGTTKNSNQLQDVHESTDSKSNNDRHYAYTVPQGGENFFSDVESFTLETDKTAGGLVTITQLRKYLTPSTIAVYNGGGTSATTSPTTFSATIVTK